MENISNKIRCFTPKVRAVGENNNCLTNFNGNNRGGDPDGEGEMSAGAYLAEMCLKIPPTDVMGLNKLDSLLNTNLKVKEEFER